MSGDAQSHQLNQRPRQCVALSCREMKLVIGSEQFATVSQTAERRFILAFGPPWPGRRRRCSHQVQHLLTCGFEACFLPVVSVEQRQTFNLVFKASLLAGFDEGVRYPFRDGVFAAWTGFNKKQFHDCSLMLVPPGLYRSCCRNHLC